MKYRTIDIQETVRVKTSSCAKYFKMAQLARVATNIAANNRRVFVIGVGMTKVNYDFLRRMNLISSFIAFIDFE